MTATRAEPESPADDARLSASATVVVVRQIAVYALTAVSSMVVVRSLAPESFGAYAAGLAAATLFLGLTDFGFAQTLGRTLGAEGEAAAATVRRIVRAHLWRSAGVGAVALGTGLVWGRYDPAGLVLAVTAPMIASGGLGSLRQVCYWRHAVRPMARIDLCTGLAQAAGLVTVARAGGPVLLLAAVTCASALLNGLLVARFARRLLPVPPASAAGAAPAAAPVLRTALPLGFALFVPTAYYHADMLLLRGLADGVEVGHYAAAVKFLSVFVVLPGVVMGLVMPHLAGAGRDRAGLTAVVRQVGHWFGALLLPVAVGVATFSPLVVRLVYGPQYAAAAPLLTILMAGAAVGLVANLVGTLMVADGRSRWLLHQNLLALAVNVAGNALLVPRGGATASAWLTVLTEVMVTSGSLWAVRHRFDRGPLLRACRPAVLGCVAIVLLGLLGRDHLGVALAAGAACAAVLTVLRGWPPDLVARLPRRGRPAAVEA